MLCIFGRNALFLIGLLLLAAPSANAHKVTVFAWVEGDTIHTRSKFSGGKHVQNGKIDVFDAAGNKLLEGNTDEQGNFSFPVPAKSELKIVLTAGSGHSNHWIVPAEEIGGHGTQADTQTQSVANRAVGTPASVVETTCLQARDIERIIELSLERKLAPLKAQLADPAWGLRDIVAGFGYILGLMGLASYIHFRKQVRRKA